MNSPSWSIHSSLPICTCRTAPEAWDSNTDSSAAIAGNAAVTIVHSFIAGNTAVTIVDSFIAGNTAIAGNAAGALQVKITPPCCVASRAWHTYRRAMMIDIIPLPVTVGVLPLPPRKWHCGGRW